MGTLGRFGHEGIATGRTGGGQTHNLMVHVYCHSYPHAISRADVLDSETLLLHCDMSGVPAHAFLEVEFELYLDNEIKKYRLPVYQPHGERKSVVRFSFTSDGAVIESFERHGNMTLQSGTA